MSELRDKILSFGLCLVNDFWHVGVQLLPMVALTSGALHGIDKQLIELLLVLRLCDPKSLIILEEIFDLKDGKQILLELVFNRRSQASMIGVKKRDELCHIFILASKTQDEVVDGRSES